MVPESYAFPAKVARGQQATEEQLEEHQRVLRNVKRPEIRDVLFYPESWL